MVKVEFLKFQIVLKRFKRSYPIKPSNTLVYADLDESPSISAGINGNVSPAKNVWGTVTIMEFDEIPAPSVKVELLNGFNFFPRLFSSLYFEDNSKMLP